MISIHIRLLAYAFAFVPERYCYKRLESCALQCVHIHSEPLRKGVPTCERNITYNDLYISEIAVPRSHVMHH